MFREFDVESKASKRFEGPLLAKMKRDQERRETEKPQVVFLPVAKQDKPALTKGIQTPRVETLPYRAQEPVKPVPLPYRPLKPVLLPLAVPKETEAARGGGGFGSQGRSGGFGGGFGGSQMEGAGRQERKPVMLPLAQAARDAMPYGGLPKQQLSALAERPAWGKPQTLPLPGRPEAEYRSFATSYDVQAELNRLRGQAAAFRTAQSDLLTLGGDPGTDAQLERVRREIAALTPIYEQKKWEEAGRSDAEKWARWNALASLDRPFTEGERAEAKDTMKEMGHVLSRIPSSGEERGKRSSYEQLYAVLHNKTNLGASIAAGFLTSFPLAKTALKKSDGWLGEYKREMEEKYPDLSIKDPTLKETMAAKGSIAASFDDAKETSRVGYKGGQIASNVMQMYGLGKVFGAAVKGVPMLSKLPTAIQGALATGGATGTLGALYEAEEGGSAEDVAKSFGVNALAGGAGSLASAGMGMFGTKALYGLGIQHSMPAIILRDGLSGAAYSAGSMGARYTLDENYRPSTEEAAKDAAVGFFFGAVTSLLKSSGMTREAKARMGETVEQMKRDYGAILADSGGKVTLDALSSLSAKSAQVRGILGSTQFVGQQATVKGVLQFLDTLDDAVERARAGMQGLVPGGGGAAPGLPPSLPIPGGAGTRGMPMLPSSVEDRDDWEVAIEEAVAEQGVKDPEDVDISGENDIIIGRSIGAKGKNYDVFDPKNGRIYHFSEGQHLQDIETFAGHGTRVPLHEGVAEGLTERFGGDVTKWQHVKGFGYLDVDGEDVFAEVHWFQNAGAGKVLFKVKGELIE